MDVEEGLAVCNRIAALEAEVERLKATLRAVQDRLDFRPLDDAFKARDACDAIRGMVVDGLKGNP